MCLRVFATPKCFSEVHVTLLVTSFRTLQKTMSAAPSLSARLLSVLLADKHKN